MIDADLILSSLSDEVACIDKFIGDDICSQLANRLRENAFKKRLILRGNCIGPRGAHSLADMLNANNTIEYISLEWNEIASAGVLFLSMSLETNRTLTALDLRNNGINDDGATALAKALQTNETLKVLDLRWNQIADAGALCFKEPLSHRKQYLNIQLSGNLMSQGVLTMIENASTPQEGEPTPIIDPTPTITYQSVLPPVISPEQMKSPIMSTVTDSPVPINSLLQSEINLLRQQSADRSHTMEDLERQLTTSAVRITELEQQLLHEKYQSAQLNEALKSTKTRLSDTTNDLNTLKSRFEMERVETTEEVKRMIREREEEFHTVVKERDLLKEKIRKTDLEMNRMTNDMQTMEQIHKEQVISLHNELGTMIAKVSELETQRSRMQLDTDAQKGSLERAQAKITMLQNELEEARTDAHAALAAESAKADQEIKRLNSEMEQRTRSANEHIDRLASELQNSRERIRVLQTDLATQQMEVPLTVKKAVSAAREEERTKYESLLEEGRARLDDFMSIRYQLEERCSVLTSEAQALREEHTTVSTDLRMQIQDLTKSLDVSKQQERDLKDSVVSLTRENSTYASQIRLMREELASMTEQEKHWHTECKNTLLAKQNLENEVSKLRATVTQLREMQAEMFQQSVLRITQAVQKNFEDLSVTYKQKLPSLPHSGGSPNPSHHSLGLQTHGQHLLTQHASHHNLDAISSKGSVIHSHSNHKNGSNNGNALDISIASAILPQSDDGFTYIDQENDDEEDEDNDNDDNSGGDAQSVISRITVNTNNGSSNGLINE